MNVLDHLVEEHQKVESLLGVLEQSNRGDERELTLRELETALHMHMALEEQFVHPLVKLHLGEDAFDGSNNEHELTRGHLFQVRNLSDQPGFVAAVDALRAGLVEHVEEEQSHIFLVLRAQARVEIEELGDAEDLEVRATEHELRDELHDDGLSSSDMTPDELRAAMRQYEATHRA